MKRICSLTKILIRKNSGIIFNGLTGAVLRANDSLISAYKLALEKQPLDQEMIEALFPDHGIRKTMEQEYILVPVKFDEYAFIEKARSIILENDIGTNIEFVVSYRCNFHCVYCYAGQASPHMSKEIAQRAADFASKMAKNRNSKAMKIQFIGGEPLLNTQAIEIICDHMSTFRDKQGLIMSTSLTSNGSLLTPRILQKIRSVGPIEVQITLDGPEHVHNKRRPMKNGNSYQAIVNNIKKCAEVIDSLTVRINIDYDNVDFIPDFLNHIRGFLPDDTSLAMVPTFAHTNASDHYASNCFKNNELSPQLIKVWTEALSLGFPPSWNPIPTFMSCGAVMPGSISIDPLGDIYKCAATYGDKSMRVGTIKHGLEINQGTVYDQFVNRDKKILSSGQCRGCSALPVCMGGCSFRSLRKNGVMHKADCRYDQKECLNDFLSQYFDWHLHKHRNDL